MAAPATMLSSVSAVNPVQQMLNARMSSFHCSARTALTVRATSQSSSSVEVRTEAVVLFQTVIHARLGNTADSEQRMMMGARRYFAGASLFQSSCLKPDLDLASRLIPVCMVDAGAEVQRDGGAGGRSAALTLSLTPVLPAFGSDTGDNQGAGTNSGVNLNVPDVGDAVRRKVEGAKEMAENARSTVGGSHDVTQDVTNAAGEVAKDAAQSAVTNSAEQAVEGVKSVVSS